ncbi:GNAT family N-acetyltransferase [Mesorhizobium onobrychidis]|uniref:GNAT family N-acetyltransferase n=1 Tax=Mesorhizobium onobrychidis TaxID=2775404 RepID=A0ABY5QVZ2_9HYPH|nr:GNAT family N-acetyltransferase [Mesorhizobium onobrychidis]UVC15198.1 GNAT family N-acetyltransferase [Mesorhizobium onobrychidis]
MAALGTRGSILAQLTYRAARLWRSTHGKRLYRRSYADVPTAFKVGEIPSEFILGELQDIDTLLGASFFYIDQSGDRIGLIHTTQRGETEDSSSIDLVLVSADHRSRGIGSVLVDATLQSLASDGHTDVASLTWQSNVGMNATFSKRGGRRGLGYFTYTMVA